MEGQVDAQKYLQPEIIATCAPYTAVVASVGSCFIQLADVAARLRVRQSFGSLSIEESQLLHPPPPWVPAEVRIPSIFIQGRADGFEFFIREWGSGLYPD